MLILVPLLRPIGLPSFHRLSAPISLGQPLAESPVRAHAASNLTSSHPAQFFFRRPPLLSSGPHPAEDDGPPQNVGSGPYVFGARGDARGLPNLFDDGVRPVLPAPPPVAVIHPLRLSHMSEGDLIYKVLPVYPALARAARIQGAVELQAVISKQGTIENLRALHGHPMLVRAAADAVRQWRYRPYVLNNEPVEVETQITVNFSLTGN